MGGIIVPSKANNNCTRNIPKNNQIKWAALKCYNAQFLENEIEIFNKLSAYNITTSLWDEYHLDQQINDRGVRVDSDFVNSAINIDEKACSEIKAQMKILTGLDNPNSPTQMKQWLATQNITAQSLDKNSVANILHSAPPLAKNVLTLWQQLKKTSVEKYNAMNSVIVTIMSTMTISIRTFIANSAMKPIASTMPRCPRTIVRS